MVLVPSINEKKDLESAEFTLLAHKFRKLRVVILVRKLTLYGTLPLYLQNLIKKTSFKQTLQGVSQ